MKNKDKRFYKIDPSTNKVVAVYSKVKDIPSFNGGFYQHLRGFSDLHTDGYIYRRAEDVVLDESNGNVVLQDKLSHNSSKNRRYKKYSRVIDMLNQYRDEPAFSVYKRLQVMGVDVSHETVRKLKMELNI